MSDIRQILGKYAPDIDAYIKAMLQDAPPFIHGMISYHFGWVDQNFQPTQADRGKMLRPTISLLVYEAIADEYQRAVPLAAAIEMIHNFSLLHDDIEDNDVERRGRATAWSIWGKPRVINGGDYLYSLAYQCLYRLESQFAPAPVFSVLNTMVEACLKLTKGQDLDMSFEDNFEVSTDMYLEMIYKKTGALIEAAIVSGATLATSDTQLIQHYHEFARNIGLAFQIQDDILGIWGDSTKTGKSTANDIRRKKKTLPIIYTLDKATGPRQERLKTYYTKPDPLSEDEIAFVRESLAWAEAHAYAQAAARTYRDTAFDALAQTGLTNESHTQLETLARFLVDRSY